MLQQRSTVRRSLRPIASVAILASILFCGTAFAQKSKPGQNLMLPAVIPTTAEKEDWKVFRERIHHKILESWGKCPVKFGPARNAYKEVARREKADLKFVEYSYEALPDSWHRGIMVLPPNFDPSKKYPLILAIHGTNGSAGGDGVLRMEGDRSRAYGIELARRGYLVFAPDHFGFGADLKDAKQEDVYAAFAEKYPDWTLTGRQILGFIRAIDFVSQLSFVDMSNGVGAIGNSLGGKSTLYLTAFDERVTAATVSTGISPMISNSYRGLGRMGKEQPFYWNEVAKNAVYLWDYNELIALCAPRAVLILEPTNDPYNPSVEFSIQAILSAMPVWRVLGKPERLTFIIHGDGHDTTEPVREFAYDWFDRFVMKK